MWTEQKLDEMLSKPSKKLIEDIKKIDGDIMILGAGGKMGPTLSLLTKRAINEAGVTKRVIAVSRFTDPVATKLLTDNGIEIISADLLIPGELEKLPDVKNIIFMAGRKFGTAGQEALTWAMNAWLPSRVAERFKEAHFVVFSTGNVYPLVRVDSGGFTEDTAPEPIGEYGMSSLARERMFEYGAMNFNSKVFIYRLNYAVDLRYGVLFDLANSLINNQPISVRTPVFNCIWQGDANEMAVRALLYTSNPAEKMNITGPEAVSVKYAAEKLGKLLKKEPIYVGEESDMACLSNAGKAIQTFGYPTVSLNTLIEWQAQWILDGGRSLDKATHFEERKGKY